MSTVTEMTKSEAESTINSVAESKNLQEKIICEWCITQGHKIQKHTRSQKKSKDAKEEIKD